MALRTPVSFIGQIEVVSGLNDTVHWDESGYPGLSASLTPGWYWPLDLALHIATEMSTESAASGASNTYTALYDVSTGLPTMQRLLGSADWNPLVTASEAQNIWTGGAVDSNGATLSNDQYGMLHFGWKIGTSSPAAAANHTAVHPTAGSWLPSLAPARWSEPQFEATVVEAIAYDGSGDVYSFNDWSIDTNEFPLYGGDWQTQELTFQRQTQDDTTAFLTNFWGPHAKDGGKFRFYPDKSDASTFYTCRLSGDSLKQASRGVRETGYALWSIDLSLRRAPA